MSIVRKTKYAYFLALVVIMDNFAGGRHVTLLNKCRVRRCLIQCQSKVTSIAQSIVLHRYLYMYFPRSSKDWINIKPNFYIWATYFLCLSLTWSIPVGISVSTHYFSKETIQRDSQTKKRTSVRSMES